MGRRSHQVKHPAQKRCVHSGHEWGSPAVTLIGLILLISTLRFILKQNIDNCRCARLLKPMKKLFRRKSSVSTPYNVHGGTTTIYSPEQLRQSLTRSDTVVPRSGSQTSEHSRLALSASADAERQEAGTLPHGNGLDPCGAEVPQGTTHLNESLYSDTDVLSVALSESETLFPTERLRLDLQPTYYENFSQYVPFLLRRVRLERERAEAEARGSQTQRHRILGTHNQSYFNSVDSIEYDYSVPTSTERESVATDTERESVSSDDVQTLIGNPNALTADQRQQIPEGCTSIMARQPTNYDYKRSLILVSELLKTDYLVFSDRSSYELFKELKAKVKKNKKSNVILYDANSQILKVDKNHFCKHFEPLASSMASSEKRATYKKSNTKHLKSSRQQAGMYEHDKHKSENWRSDKEKARCSADFQPDHDASDMNKQVAAFGSPPEEKPSSIRGNIAMDVQKQSLQLDSEQYHSHERPLHSCVVDSRHHIVPIEMKVLGKGLPLLKAVFPYMSAFRKNVPYMILKRYKEIPDRPSGHEEGDFFETYDFCTVQMKGFNLYKRYIFLFRPAGMEAFKVLAYQCNFRPFTDFKYKGTRFRIFGSSMATAYILNYNPDMKLFIVDENKPSLVDKLINKRHNGDLLSISRNKSSNTSNSSKQKCKDLTTELEPEQVDNPVPHRDNPILQDHSLHLPRTYENSYVPNNMPPFSRYTDASVYLKDSLIVPKKLTEVGKFDIYQSLDNSLDHFGGNVRAADLSSTFSVPVDTLVLTSIFLALRETNIRTTKRYPTTNSVARMGVLATTPVNLE